uniref:Double-headed protease inhibitor, submandibular gland n=1 Tax=Ursus maritimus TaxID=29073 RepID=A0A452TZ27_URSMA
MNSCQPFSFTIILIYLTLPNCLFHICFLKDKRGWMARSEGQLPRKGVLRRRLSHIDCGEFRDPKVYCTRESNPHCGSDGQTYGNKCAFCKAMVKSGGKISLKHQGKC